MKSNDSDFHANLYNKTRKISGIGLWHVDLINQSVYWDEQTKMIHEVGMDYLPDLESGINFYKEGVNRKEITRLCNEVVEDHKPFETNLEILTAKGNAKWVRVVGMPELLEGKVVSFHGTFQDITEEHKKLSEIDILKERTLLATYSSNVGIWDYRIKENELHWDDQMFNLYNVKKEDFLGAYEAWENGLHPDDRAAGEKAVEDAIADVKPFDIQFRVVWPSGEIRHIQAKAKVFRNEKGEAIRMLGTNWDVTEEVEQSIQLKDYTSKMKIVQEQLKIAMWKWDPITNEAEWDDELYDLYGISKNSKDKIAEWESKIEPETAKEIWAELADSIAGNSEYDKIFKMNVDGTEKYFRGKSKVIKKKNGEIDYVLGSNIDVSKDVQRELDLEQKNERLQVLSEKLKQSNEQLEEFAYIASHDLKAPIRHMAAYASFLEEDLEESLDDESKKMIQGIKDQAKRMTNLVEDLLTYSRVNKINLQVLNAPVNKMVEEVVELLGYQEDDSIQIEVEDLGMLKVDVIKMSEVFNNLLTNSVKYNDSEIKKIKIWREGNQILLKDNGIGIDEKQKDKVFAFFRRLHGKEEYGGGTGAGMAIVKSVLDRHNASIDFKSKVGEGTTFLLDFEQCQLED